MKKKGLPETDFFGPIVKEKRKRITRLERRRLGTGPKRAGCLLEKEESYRSRCKRGDRKYCLGKLKKREKGKLSPHHRKGNTITATTIRGEKSARKKRVQVKREKTEKNTSGRGKGQEPGSSETEIGSLMWKNQEEKISKAVGEKKKK